MEEVSIGAGSRKTTFLLSSTSTSTITATTSSFLFLPWNLPLLSTILASTLAQFLKHFTTWFVWTNSLSLSLEFDGFPYWLQLHNHYFYHFLFIFLLRRNQSWVSQFTPLHKSPHLLLIPTIVSSPHTFFLIWYHVVN